MQPQQTRQQTMQRQYKTKRRMRRGIRHETAHGWRVVGTMEDQPGCLHRLTFGIFARGRYIVTFAR